MSKFTPGASIKSYALIERLGKGASGEVWKAGDGAFKVALKLLNPQVLRSARGRSLRQRQERELDALRHLHEQPHLPIVYDWDLDYPQPYVAAQYIEGDTFDRLIRTGRMLRVPLEQRLAIIQQLAAALAAAHKAGIVHRDIKPANASGLELPYLLDFGVALDEADVDRTQSTFATRLYLPYDGGVDKLGDMYSFGLLAYEILIGQHALFAPVDYPMLQSTPLMPMMTAAERIKNGQWRWPSLLPLAARPPDLADKDLAALDRIFQQVLGSRDSRYEDSRLLAQHLEEVLEIDAGMADRAPDEAVQPESEPEEIPGRYAPIEMAERRQRYAPLAQETRPTLWPAKSVVPVHYDPEEQALEPDLVDTGDSPLVQITVAFALVGILILGALVIFGMPGDSGAVPEAGVTAAVVIRQSDTPTLTATLAPSETPRPPSPSPAVSASFTASATASLSASPSRTASPTPSQNPTATPSATLTPTMISTNTPLPTPFPTNTPIPLPTAFVASDSLRENLLALRQAINGPRYDCEVYNILYDHIQARTVGSFENNLAYERFGRRILDEMGGIYQGFCLLVPDENSTLPEQYANANRALDLLLWETILALGPAFQ